MSSHLQDKPSAGSGAPVPFPIERSRSPASTTAISLRQGLPLVLATVELAEHFGRMPPRKLDDRIADDLRVHGSEAVAKLLENKTAAISSLRALLAGLIEADRRIAASADRVLTAAGLPSEVR